MELELSINGVIASLDVAPSESLLSLLRREGYTSVKCGCETGECGACTILIDGAPRPSCVMLAAQAGGCTITTTEGLGSSRLLHPLQQAFAETGAAQCGFCTPGMLLSAQALLKRSPAPTESEVRDALSGHLCRCNGYAKAIQAVLLAASTIRGEHRSMPDYNIVKSKALGSITRPMHALSAANNQTHTVGKPVLPADAIEKVTGRASFAADFTMQGMLYGRVLISPHAHAVIRNIDASRARSLPGVHAVLTCKDVPRVPYSSVESPAQEQALRDQYLLDYIVRYAGDRVAAVAAETPEIAEQALRLVDVDYEVLPGILDPRQSRDSDAPCIHPETDSQGIYDAARNVAARVLSEQGDVENGFSESDRIIEGEYVLPLTHSAPIENHTTITYFDENDCLVVRTSTQAPHHVRRTLARILNVPLSRVRVVRPDLGGGLGVKQEVVLEDLCSLLTIATNRPVMLAFSRAEELISTRVQQQYIVRLKTGVKRDGTIVANQMALITSTGAYATHPLIEQGAASALSLYPCPHQRFVAEVLYTNLPPSGAYRGSGSPQEFFALESHMDEIARQLEIDALELRRKNWLKAGDPHPLPGTWSDSRPIVESCGLPECLRVVEEQLRWREKRGGSGSGRTRRGVGIALSHYGVHPYHGISGAIIKLNEDGTIDLFAGANDAGHGSSTMLAQIAAETLGIAPETVLVHSGDTDIVPNEIGSHSSTTLYASGGAALRAAEQLRRQILVIAGRMLNALPESLKINSGIIIAPDDQATTIAQVAAHALYVENRHIMTTATWKVPQIPISFAALGAEVEVDTETGAVRVLKAVCAVDAGCVINPLLLEIQVQGNMVQGLGAGTCEELIYDQQGRLLATSLRDYRLYGALDIPELQTYLVETSDPLGPQGIKAVAELPAQCMPAALASAVADAIGGTRVRQLPLTPERVLRAIHANAQKKQPAQPR